MPALTLLIDNIRPIVAEGSIKERVYRISGAIANNDTVTIVEFNTVIFATLTAGSAGATVPGLTLSGTGNRTITFKLSANVTDGLLLVKGF